MVKAKDLISKLYDKYYGKRKEKAAVVKEKETKFNQELQMGNGVVAVPVVGKPYSRNDLMLKAKERGVKNYRVLNKQELIDCLTVINEKDKELVIAKRMEFDVKINAIVSGAVARWKLGWGKKGRRT